MELVRGTLHHYSLGRCSALFLSAQRWRQVRGGRAGAGSRLPPPPLPLFVAPLAVLDAGCPVRVSPALACWYAIPRGLCVPGARSSYPFGARRASVVFSCARAPKMFLSPPPPPLPFGRALRKVPSQDTGRAIPGDLCPSAFLSRFPCPAYR